MPNIPLAYVSVYRRMSDIFHTLAYACTIRNSVTGPLRLFSLQSYSGRKNRVTIFLKGQFIIVYTCKPHMNDKYSILWLCTFSSKMTHSTEQQNLYTLPNIYRQ
jgi:hypothetical protein